ncbi:hypothetical protein Q5752_001234 [Cryptotrichosporon argae]
MSLRSALPFARATRAVRIAPAARTIATTAPRLQKTPDELKKEYEAHRVSKEPRNAAIDESIRFNAPENFSRHDVGHSGQPAEGRHTKRTLQSFSLEGKVCVVTGAARGLGNMFARTFVESGADTIVLIDLNQADAERAAEELEAWFVENGEAKPGEIQALGLGANVADEASVAAAFKKIDEKFGGRVDAVVTAAGIVENFVAHEYPTEKVRKLLDINVMGTWFCALEAAKRMPQGGSITLIGSMSGNIVNVPQPQTPYNFSKAAVRHMARSLAVEWAKQDIRVNCISPGYTLTNLTKVILDNNPVLRDTWINAIPMGRMADPSDLKGAVVYLASDASKYTTGSEIVIDGGYTCL